MRFKRRGWKIISGIMKCKKWQRGGRKQIPVQNKRRPRDATNWYMAPEIMDLNCKAKRKRLYQLYISRGKAPLTNNRNIIVEIWPWRMEYIFKKKAGKRFSFDGGRFFFFFYALWNLTHFDTSYLQETSLLSSFPRIPGDAAPAPPRNFHYTAHKLPFSRI